jgi:hypothetical protein
LNKSFIRIGILIVLAGVGIAGFGLLTKISYDGCLELAMACERGQPSGGCPLCPADDSPKYFLVGLPVTGVGVTVFVLAIKDIPALQRLARKYEK